MMTMYIKSRPADSSVKQAQTKFLRAVQNTLDQRAADSREVQKKILAILTDR